MLRHLIYHIWPARHTDMWRWNLDQLKTRLGTFNGRKIIGIATDNNSVSSQTVIDYLEGHGCEFITVKNLTDKGELATFEKMLNMVKTLDRDTLIFYAHAKGVKYNTVDNRNKTIRQWTELMYHHSLDDIERVESAIQNKTFAGCFRRHPSPTSRHYYFSGTFFWMNAARLFSKPHDLRTRERWGVEFWPATVTPITDTVCLFGDNAGRLYSQAQLDSAIANGTAEIPVAESLQPKRCKRITSNELPPRRPVGAVKSNGVSVHKRSQHLQPSLSEETAAKYFDGVTLITPTGDRPEAFALCEKWMGRQSYQQWIVVDDGQIPTVCTANQEYIRREPGTNEGHTLTRNLREALPLIRYNKVLIIEDDEWYAPTYIENMANWLDDSPLVGAGYARYYWPNLARYREFPNHKHSSLCRTGFRVDVLPTFAACCALDDPSVDMRLWSALGSYGARHMTNRPLVIGMKQMAGRPSGGGDSTSGNPDTDLSVLRNWIGDDIAAYSAMLPKHYNPRRAQTEKIVVYTVVLGGYDNILPPLNVNPDVRYVAITDGTAPQPWEVVAPPQSDMEIKHKTRWLKSLAHCMFPYADWTIYLDGQLQLKVDPVKLIAECEAWGQSDLYMFRHQDRNCIYAEARAVKRIGKDRSDRVTRQIDRYKARGFPAGSGLYLGGMLIRRGGDGCATFNSAWWSEIRQGSHRDQISMPVALQDSGVSYTALPALWWLNFFNRQHHNRNNFSRGGVGLKAVPPRRPMKTPGG